MQTDFWLESTKFGEWNHAFDDKQKMASYNCRALDSYVAWLYSGGSNPAWSIYGHGVFPKYSPKAMLRSPHETG